MEQKIRVVKIYLAKTGICTLVPNFVTQTQILVPLSSYIAFA